MEDEVAAFVHYPEITPGALEEFLAGYAADNIRPWQRLSWWRRLQIFLLGTEIFGDWDNLGSHVSGLGLAGSETITAP